MDINQKPEIELEFHRYQVELAAHFRQAFKPKTAEMTAEDYIYHKTELFILDHADLLDNRYLDSMGTALEARINIIKEDLSGITGFVRYFFYGDIKKALKKEKRQMRQTMGVINAVRSKKWAAHKQPSSNTPSPLQRDISPLTPAPEKEVPVPQAAASQTNAPATPAINQVASQSPLPPAPQLPVDSRPAPPPPAPRPPNAPPAPRATGAPPPPPPAAKQFTGEVAEPKVSVTAKELDPNRKAKEGERSPAEVRSLVEQEITTITIYIDTMKKSLKPVETILKRSDDITSELDNLKILYTPIKQKINNYNQVLDQLNHHIETFGIQIPKEKDALPFPVLNHELFAEVEAELQKEGKSLSLKFSAEEIQSTLKTELKILNSQFDEYERNRADLQEELKSILNQENNGIKFSAYKALFDSKTKTVEKWERALNNRKAFLTKLKESEKTKIKTKEAKVETPVPIEEDKDLSPEERAKKAKVKEIVATIKKLFSVQNFAILMRAATVAPLVDLFKTTISDMTEAPKEYNF